MIDILLSAVYTVGRLELIVARGLMTKRTVLSDRLVKSKAALKGIPLSQVNAEAGFGPNYIYRLWGTDKMQLSTINKIADVLGCKSCDLLEEVEVADPEPTATR